MVLIGLIIIAVALMALLVLGLSGIRWKPPARIASRRAGPGSARVPGR
jgi:formate hydrogenlyase subunit 4